jgi:hypothetical protein
MPVKMEQTECSETSAFKTQTPGNYPKEIIQRSKQGESLKSRIPTICNNNFPQNLMATAGGTTVDTECVEDL